MSWFRIDDQFFHNRKARAVGPLGRELFVASGCYCATQLNDGCFIAEDLPVIAALAQVEQDIAGRLITHELWHPEGHDCPSCRSHGQVMPVPPGHISIHEYLERNPSREKVLGERAAAAERQRRSREKSRRDSRVTSNGSHGVSHPHPVPSRPPNETVLSSSLATHEPDAERHDEDELSTGDVPDEVWRHYADLKLAFEPAGSVRSAGAWKRKTRENAQVELADDARRWWSMFDLTPRRLAECLIDGQAPRNVPHRTGPEGAA